MKFLMQFHMKVCMESFTEVYELSFIWKILYETSCGILYEILYETSYEI